MNKINVCIMTDGALESLRTNAKKATANLKYNDQNSEWLSSVYKGELFTKLKYQINDFELQLSKTGDYKDVDLENSIVLYENLKKLPKSILSDERFWAWINFTKGYKAALQAMKINNERTFLEHWLFAGGNRRGIFFGVMSRCFFRVALSVDENREDKYELTKFAIEKIERFRNLTWRTNSNNKNTVIAVLSAEKAIEDKYGDRVYNEMYTEIAKYISLYAGTHLIDAMSKEDLYNLVYNKLEQLLKEKHKLL